MRFFSEPASGERARGGREEWLAAAVSLGGDDESFASALDGDGRARAFLDGVFGNAPRPRPGAGPRARPASRSGRARPQRRVRERARRDIGRRQRDWRPPRLRPIAAECQAAGRAHRGARRHRGHLAAESGRRNPHPARRCRAREHARPPASGGRRTGHYRTPEPGRTGGIRPHRVRRGRARRRRAHLFERARPARALRSRTRAPPGTGRARRDSAPPRARPCRPARRARRRRLRLSHRPQVQAQHGCHAARALDGGSGAVLREPRAELGSAPR